MSEMQRVTGGNREERRARLLRALGARVRARRTSRGLTLRALAQLCEVSERFLVQLETGEGNISVARLDDVAQALGTTAADLLSAREVDLEKQKPIVLLGLRGAGKSTIGAAVAKRLGLPFVELDLLVAKEAGMSLTTLFDLHGDAYFRRLEREALRKLLDAGEPKVIATGGSIVTAPETFNLLRARATTVWLKARAKDHWDRVVSQGDVRPMKNRTNAMSELRALLRAREHLYAQADHVVDTSSVTLNEAVKKVITASSRHN